MILWSNLYIYIYIFKDDKIMDGRVNICLTLPSTQNTKRSLVTLVLISLLLVN